MRSRGDVPPGGTPGKNACSMLTYTSWTQRAQQNGQNARLQDAVSSFVTTNAGLLISDN